MNAKITIYSGIGIGNYKMVREPVRVTFLGGTSLLDFGTYKNKIDGIETGAQVNRIEKIYLDEKELEINENKEIHIECATKEDIIALFNN